MYFIINIDYGLKEPTQGYQICNTNPVPGGELFIPCMNKRGCKKGYYSRH